MHFGQWRIHTGSATDFGNSTVITMMALRTWSTKFRCLAASAARWRDIAATSTTVTVSQHSANLKELYDIHKQHGYQNMH